MFSLPFLLRTWGIYLQSFSHISFAILSSYPNVQQLEVSRVWFPEWNKKAKDFGQMALSLVAISNDDILLAGLDPVSFL